MKNEKAACDRCRRVTAVYPFDDGELSLCEPCFTDDMRRYSIYLGVQVHQWAKKAANHERRLHVCVSKKTNTADAAVNTAKELFSLQRVLGYPTRASAELTSREMALL